MADVPRDDQIRDHGLPASARPRRRSPREGRRSRTIRFALTEDEYAEVSAAARQAGLARGAYAAEAALSVARGTVTTPDAPLRDAFYALDRAAVLVGKIGVNLNQAVRKLNATGQRSGDLLPVCRRERPPRRPAGAGRGRPADQGPARHPRSRTRRPLAGPESVPRPPIRMATRLRARWPRPGPDRIPRRPSAWPGRRNGPRRSAWPGTAPVAFRASGDERIACRPAFFRVAGVR